MAFRMLRYVVEFYGGLLKRKPRPQKLPAVFPILLYNGDQRWTSPESFTDLVDPRIQGEFIPQFRYYKIAENEFDPAYLASLHNLVAALFLVETSDVAELKARLDQIVSILEHEQPEAVNEFIRWLHAHFGDPVPQWVDDTRTLQEVPTMLATALKKKEQEWYKEGQKEGRMEGQREGRLEGQREGITLGEQKGRIEKAKETARKLKEEGVPLAVIVKATGLSREEVEAL